MFSMKEPEKNLKEKKKVFEIKSLMTFLSFTESW